MKPTALCAFSKRPYTQANPAPYPAPAARSRLAEVDKARSLFSPGQGLAQASPTRFPRWVRLLRATGKIVPQLGVPILLLTLAGCASPPRPRPAPVSANLVSATTPQKLDAQLLAIPPDAFTLGPGDRLEVEFIGDTTSRSSCEVGPDGKIYFNLLPGIDVWGLTLAQTRNLITTRSTQFLRETPNVALNLQEVASKRVWVLGSVNQPGIYPIIGPMPLLAALAEAGGPTTAEEGTTPLASRSVAADLRRSFVLRRGEILPVDFERLVLQGDVSQNIYLRPGDFVYLPAAAAQTVHVLGAVSVPGAVYSGDGITLIQTIASAGGTIKDAYVSHVAIVRGSLTQPTISVVDYKAIIKGTAPDVILEPHDIVYIPYTPYRTLGRYMDLILRTFVQTVGVNEGAHAVDANAGSVGVNVQVNPR
jgi:polysaccharide export outer membrane protein